MSRRGARAAGLTLIEVMVAIFVLALMMAIAWGSLRETAAAKKHYGQVGDRYREARVALSRIARDLSMAYLSANEDRSLMEPRTFLRGEASSDADTLSFSALAHVKLYAEAHESDQTVIAYYTAPDEDARERTNLMRREVRRPGNEKLEDLPGEADVLFTGVAKFKLSYWDAKDQEWTDSWSTQAADGKVGRVPDRVKIALSFADEHGKEITLVTQARVFMQEMLQFYAN